jgi:ATP-dependent RNA helicase DeaD
LNTITEKEDQKEHDAMAEPVDALPPVALAQLPVRMREGVQRAGWEDLAPVQSKAIPYFQAHRDMMVQAQTGSGKTGAYLLPILEQVDLKKNACQFLILVPTRELAQQVATEAEVLAGDIGMRTVAVYGGASYKPQIEAFKKGAQLVVGTPGRIIDHLIKRNLDLKDLKVLIFDEADRMMSMGFYPDMIRVRDFLPGSKFNSYMFSATFTAHVMRLSHQFLNKPGFLSLSRDHVHVEDTRHLYYITPGMDKDRSLVRLIEMENPSQAIIFCNTKDRVNYVATVLQRFGYNADQLSSDLSQNKREVVLQRLRSGKLRFLVATDVAARGIDITDLSHVFQYEPSEELESYIHRAGRTGRAGASGTAILLINYNEKKYIKRIGAHFNLEFEEAVLPKDEDVQNLVSQRLISQLEGRLRNRDRLQIERMRRFVPLAQQLSQDEDGLALLTMLLDDTYHDWMHQPPELPPVSSQQTQAKRSQREKPQRRRGSRGRRDKKG